MHNRSPPRVRRTFDPRRDGVASSDRRMWSPTPFVPDPHLLIGEMGQGVKVLPQALRVLVVDHDLRAADHLETLLRATGYLQTHVAYSAHSAMAIAGEFCPEIVLVELDMPDIDAYLLGQTLRERAQSRRICLIAVTDNPAHRGRETARDAGFERYLFKPITARDLSACLKDAAASVK
jgi:PleD family two-component response regulator